ncbi:MAG: tol-pal system YbgF family protein [Elusimicrobiales bacterium]
MPDTTWIAGGKIEHTGPSRYDRALHWIRKNRETFIGSLVILVAAAIFAAYFFTHYRGLRDTAWKTLFMAQQIGYGGNIAQAQQQLDTIEKSYGSTSAAPYATLTKGDILYAQEKFKEAEAEYAKVLTNRDLGPFAAYNMGKAKEAAGDLAGAQVQYSDFLAKYPDHFVAPEAHISLARLQEAAGTPDLARATYEKIALLYPETTWAMMARAKTEPAKK